MDPLALRCGLQTVLSAARRYNVTMESRSSILSNRATALMLPVVRRSGREAVPTGVFAVGVPARVAKTGVRGL